MKKIILFILIFSVSAIGQLTVDSFKEIYIPKIIKSWIVGDRLYIANGYDTSYVQFLTTGQERYAQIIDRTIKEYQQRMNKEIALLLNRKLEPAQEIQSEFISGYFIVRNDRIGSINKARFVKIDSVRGSLNTAQDQYWSVMKYRIELPFADSGTDSTNYNYLMTASTNNQIRYLVPMIYTKQELIDYLTNPESVPKWSEEIGE